MKHYQEMQHAFELYLEDRESNDLHASEIAYLVKKLRKKDPEAFYKTLDLIPNDILGDVLLELPEGAKDAAIEYLSSHDLAEAIDDLESDDATDLVQDIEDVDEAKSVEVFEKLDEEDQEDIDKLRRYEDDQAGAWMQTELFDAVMDETIQSSIDRFRRLKAEGELENIYQVFIVNDHQRLITTLGLEDLIVFDFAKTYREILDSKEFRSVEATEDIEVVATMFEQYDLSVLPVVDWQGKLVGRITSDDIYDVIEERATEQIYNLAGVDDDAEQEDDLIGVFKKRSSWLFLNLITAILASLVIAMFDETLAAFIPLAILMPIVASMGGNAGTQSLTVMVRRLALGEVDSENARNAVNREIFVSLLNGFLFAGLMGIIAYFWFSNAILGVVIGAAMIINLLIAGSFGAGIPLALKRLNIDPAIGSTVLLTTATDVFGFLSFLGLAKMFLI
ncbi:MAG: magnesium transporter [Campylobacterota bacterium]|nr:magnesium transporter [Campylobacterota bacterium]